MSLIDFLQNFDTTCQTDYAKALEVLTKVPQNDIISGTSLSRSTIFKLKNGRAPLDEAHRATIRSLALYYDVLVAALQTKNGK